MVASNRPSVIVGMSGGVDSSVSAALLLQQGYQVTGLFMKNWEEEDDTVCNAAQDLADAESVCKVLGIPLKTVNFSYEYWERVFIGFLQELKKGKTPNPDIVCNVEIKFREFPQWAKKLGSEYVATGHYARIIESSSKPRLLKGRDPDKDQTYFLYAIDSNSLKKTIFPLGELTKTEVRATAKQLGLENHDKKGSTGICFIGRRNFRSFISQYIDPSDGKIIDSAGKVVGSHEGAFFYTIGQRTGLGIGGPGEPWYVARKNIGTNTLVAVQGHDHPMLFSRQADVADVNWIGDVPIYPFQAQAKIRYQGQALCCLVSQSKGRRFTVEFEQPARAVTPGQSIVLYNDEICLGGGIIENTYN